VLFGLGTTGHAEQPTRAAASVAERQTGEVFERFPPTDPVT
jgi:hypothetical protein